VCESTLIFGDKMSYTIEEALERSRWIDSNGRLLDGDWNELRDENGEVTIISENERKHFKIAKL